MTLDSDEAQQPHSASSPYVAVTWQQGEHTMNPSLQSWDYFSLEQFIVAKIV